ncbi:MAG TPA: class I tRNA ligase family protein [bacterium]|nr:class I tRNA ligase family protein [bacterium]
MTTGLGMKKQIAKSWEPEKFEDTLYSDWEKKDLFRPETVEKIRNSKSEIQKKAEPFCIIMPPPNANGSLHIGHAVFVTLEDIMTRFARLQGKAALWLPGADHAGFETQVVFEKKLEKEGKSRFQIPRDELYKQMFDFTQENKKVMEGQLRKLGASCDWEREKFTLDPDIIKTVYKTFKKLYDDGLVYRDVKPVNWCTKHQTSLSDLEVKFEEQPNPLYYIKYGPLTVATGRPETLFGDVAVAVHPKDPRYINLIGKEVPLPLTDRKITVIADEMVDPKFGTGAVKITPAHDPNDFDVMKRHGLETLEVIDNRGKLNKKAGSFAGMKIAEARTKVIEALQEKNFIEKIDENYVHTVGKCYKCGTIIEPRVLPQWFIAVNKKGKSGKILAKDALDAVKSGKTKFVTEKFEKIFTHWMTNIRDWNVSRQIVWGIQIPAWYKEIPKLEDLPSLLNGKKEIKAGEEGSPVRPKPVEEFRFVVADQEELQWLSNQLKVPSDAGQYIDFFNGKTRTRIEGDKYAIVEKETKSTGVVAKKWVSGHIEGIKGCLEIRSTAGFARYEIEFKGGIPARFKDRELIASTDIVSMAQPNENGRSIYIGEEAPKEDGWVQDSDVFDTWFSSGQWPFATLKTAKDGDFDKFYPTTVMETAYDILFFWVARMIMLGLYITDEVPFRNVYIHGLVRDKDRQKMSKSKGNVINPLGVAEIYGTDAVRMALVIGASAGNDVIISEDKIRGMRNFANKIWNASRYVLLQVTDGDLKSGELGLYTIRDTKYEILTDADEAILKAHKETIKQVTDNLENFKFWLAGEQVYDYFWHTFADVYIEVSKTQMDNRQPDNRQRINDSISRLSSESQSSIDVAENTKKILVKVLSETLIMLHPFVPFVTEAVWQELKNIQPSLADSVMVAEWPKA